MAKQPDRPGPGEQSDPDARVGEHSSLSASAPNPDATPRDSPIDGLLHSDPHTRPSGSHDPRTLDDPDSARDSVDCDLKRRTSSDRDGYEAVTPSDHATEQPRDHSAGAQRETAFDPAQDNVGPLSDKG